MSAWDESIVTFDTFLSLRVPLELVPPVSKCTTDLRNP